MNNLDMVSNGDLAFNNIWKAINVLRNDVYTNDVSVIFLFIHLRSQGMLSEDLLKFNHPKEALIKLLDKENDETIQAVYDTFIPSIVSLSNSSIIIVVEILVSIEFDWIQQNISEVYEKTIEGIALSQGRENGEFIQPSQLTEFIDSSIGLTKGKKVFNPFAGVASFLKKFTDDNRVYAQEINQTTWAIGQLRLIVNKSKAEFKCEDSILNWPANEKFDLILSNPPFGMKLSGLHRERFPHIRTTEEFLIHSGLSSLTESGKMIAVLPSGILFRGGSERNLRVRLIEEDLIDTIISFPGGILHHTGIPFIVLILNNSKDRPGKIRLVEAKDCISKPSSRENIIEVEKLLKVSQQTENTDSVRIITNDDVIANDFNLNVSRYFVEEIEGVKLREILTYYRGKRSDFPEFGKVVRIRDLKDERLDFSLNVDEINDISLERNRFHKIDTSCLLLASKWKTLKPTYFNFDNTCIFNRSDIMPFEVNKRQVDISYLINELHSEYVENQLEGLRQGSTIPFIRMDDLLEIKIKLPSLNEQRAKVSGLIEISERIKQLQSERNALVHGVKAQEFNEFASLKHTLGRPRQNILDWTDNLLHFLKNKPEGFDNLNDSFGEFYDTDILSALKEIKRDVNFMTEVLEKGENGFVVNEYTISTIPLSGINQIINELSNNGLKFNIKKHLLKGEKLKNKGVDGNKILLQTLIDNLLTNANKYGFDQKQSSNEVVIELQEIDDMLTIEVRNNGKPFPKNFDREKFITKYSTADSNSGSGLGGFDIHRIASKFNNPDWKLNLNSDPFYPVVFKFQLPIKLIS